MNEASCCFSSNGTRDAMWEKGLVLSYWVLLFGGCGCTGRDHAILYMPKWDLHLTIILLASCPRVDVATNPVFATFSNRTFAVNTGYCCQLGKSYMSPIPLDPGYRTGCLGSSESSFLPEHNQSMVKHSLCSQLCLQPSVVVQTPPNSASWQIHVNGSSILPLYQSIQLLDMGPTEIG